MDHPYNSGSRIDEVAAILTRVTGSAAVVDRPERTATAATAKGVAGLAEVANALADAGVQVEDLSLRQPTLDEVFLTLTGVPIEDGEPAGPAHDGQAPVRPAGAGGQATGAKHEVRT